MLKNIATSHGIIVKKGKKNKSPSHNLLRKLNKERKARSQICHEQKIHFITKLLLKTQFSPLNFPQL